MNIVIGDDIEKGSMPYVISFIKTAVLFKAK